MVLIKNIKSGSIAEKIGLKKGQYIISINGYRIDDMLDFRFYENEERIDLQVRGGDGAKRYIIEKEYDERLGIELSDLIIRRCQNKCIFCFMDQLPPGSRKSLYLKDDDYRLSFLYGNFITLTNLSNSDFEKIERLRLSPLYISVHTTNTKLRSTIMGNKNAEKIMEQLKRLINAGIHLHTQIVLLPGINDGDYFLESIEDLSKLFPGVASIGVVPVGLTYFREGLTPIKYPDSEWANNIIELSEPYQAEFRKKMKKTFLYLSDEIYILAGANIPKTCYYDDFPQIENGIGMVRRFINGLKNVEVPDFKGLTLLVTGILAATYIKKLEKKFKRAGKSAKTVVVPNRYFGPSVTVAGLLPGWDILALTTPFNATNLLLPPDVVNSGDYFVDDFNLNDLKKYSKKNIYIAPQEVEHLSEMKV